MFFLVACVGLNGSSGSTNPVLSVRVEPETLTLDTREGAPATATFSAIATFADDTEAPIELVSWASSSPSAGSIDNDGVFTGVETNGGETTVTATHAGVVGSAALTIRYLSDELEEGIDEALPAAFEAATATEDETLELIYPLDGVAVPRNLEGLTFAWRAEPGEVSRVRLTTPVTDVSIYTLQPEWTASSALWSAVTASNRRGEVTALVETGVWEDGTLTDVRRSTSIDLTVNRFDATGSVLYWSTSDQGILRIPIDDPEPQTFWSASDSGNRCTGCHVLVEAEDKMVVTHDGVNGTFTIVDVSDPEMPVAVITPQDTARMTFKTVSPDGLFLLGVTSGEIVLYDLRTGRKIDDIDLDNEQYTHPDWSPDGTSVVLVRATGSYASDMTFTGGEIVKVPWDGETLGDPEVLVPAGAKNNYYPAWSPDGNWVAYNRSTGDAYADLDAEIWLVSADGSVDVALVEANGVAQQQNSYVRWAPLPDDDVLWLAYSSIRPYPVDDFGNPQIWVTAVYPEEATTDGDPSRQPFWLPGQDVHSNNHLPVWWSK